MLHGGKTMKNDVSQPTNIPTYKRLSEDLIAKINNKIFFEGQKLPPDKELAKQLEVSPVTVSRACNILAQKGYLKRIRGVGTFVVSKRKRTKRVAFMTSKTDKWWTGVVASGFTNAMADNEYEVQIAPDFELDPIKEKQLLKTLNAEKIDGLFVLSRLATEQYYIELYQREKIAVVLGGGIFRQLPYVTFNDYKIGKLAAKYLIENNCKSFGVITEDYFAGRERLLGFKEELSKAGLSLKDDNIIWAANPQYLTEDELNTIADKWKPFPEGIFAHGDSYLVHLYHQYLKETLNIPDNTILVGVGNNFAHHHVPFTTVDYNLYGLGVEAGKYLLELIEHGFEKKSGKSLNRTPEPTLCVRQKYIKDYSLTNMQEILAK